MNKHKRILKCIRKYLKRTSIIIIAKKLDYFILLALLHEKTLFRSLI